MRRGTQNGAGLLEIKWTQRFGAATILNIHLHCLVLDGAYRRTDGEPVFVEVPAPSDEALQALLQKIIARLMKLLTRRGVLIEEEGSSYLADSDTESDDARTLRPLQAAAATYRIAFGPRAGQKVFTVQGAMPRDTAFTQALCADMQGFSLHAAVRCGADERQRLEQLCRYITRPAQDRRTRAVQQRRTGRAQAEDCVARRHHAHRDVATGVHAAAGRAGAPAAAAPDPIGVRVTSLREVSGLPLREPWGAGAECQAAGAGGAAGARAGHRRVGAHRCRGRLHARPAGAHQLGQAAQARL